MNDPEIIICAAVIAEDGAIYRGHRHRDCLFAMKSEGRNRDPNMSARFNEGFITSRNRYVSRKEAYEIQVAAGIHSALEVTTHADGAYLHGECYSEDLY